MTRRRDSAAGPCCGATTTNRRQKTITSNRLPGRWDLVAEIRTGDLTTLDRVLTEIRTNRAITHSETSILLAEVG